MSSATSDR